MPSAVAFAKRPLVHQTVTWVAEHVGGSGSSLLRVVNPRPDDLHVRFTCYERLANCFSAIRKMQRYTNVAS